MVLIIKKKYFVVWWIRTYIYDVYNTKKKNGMENSCCVNGFHFCLAG